MNAVSARLRTDGPNATGDRHARQSTAPLERLVADGGDREVIDSVWDDQVAGGLWDGACDGDAVSNDLV